MRTVYELDVAGDDFLGFLFRAQSRDFDVKVLDPSGPGGGNPFIRITGEDAGVQAFLMGEGWEKDDITGLHYVGEDPEEAAKEERESTLWAVGLPVGIGVVIGGLLVSAFT